MNRFLALMHDKLVPHYLRVYTDASSVDVPIDELLQAAHSIFLEKRNLMDTEEDEPDAPNPHSIIQKWIKALDRTSDVKSTPPSLEEKDFILNFLQKRSRKLRRGDDAAPTTNDLLNQQGLASTFALDTERRQRAYV